MSYETYNDGEDRKETYTYDTNGNRLSYEIDDNADGNVDYRKISTYDANGNRLSHEMDRDGDGNIDNKVTYTYDANGIIQTRTTLENNSGSKTLEKYDSFGNKISERMESLTQPTSIETTTWKGF